MSAPPEKQPDQTRIVALLAMQFQLSVEDVTALYEREHAALAIGAHVTKFLHILTLRHVQDILRNRHIEKLALLAVGRPLPSTKRLLMPLLATGSTAPAVVEFGLRARLERDSP